MDTLLKKVRLRTDFKTTQAKGIFGISQTHYTRIENGDLHASREIAEKIADFFKVPVATLFNIERYSAVAVPETRQDPQGAVALLEA